jgi:hypothetical protein
MEYVLLTLAAASPNRAYLASLRFAQIPLRGTSDTLETLDAIVSKGLEEKGICALKMDFQA